MILHKTLNPLIWTKNNELKQNVKEAILKIVDKFKENLTNDGLELKIHDIFILGSNANYNYTKESDLDVHIISDQRFDCSENHLNLLYNCYKSMFNLKYDINIKGINVELYVEDKDNLSNVSNGIYSLNKGWLKNPSKDLEWQLDTEQFDKLFNQWEKLYYQILKNPSIEKVESYINDLYKMRQDSIKNEGEFGLGNLVFKELRRLEYLRDLKELKDELIGKELSLESLNEDSSNKNITLNTNIETRIPQIKDWADKLIRLKNFKVFEKKINDLKNDANENIYTICYLGAFLYCCYYSMLGFDTHYVLGYLANQEEKDYNVIGHAWCEKGTEKFQTRNLKNIKCNELDRISFKANTSIQEIRDRIIDKFISLKIGNK